MSSFTDLLVQGALGAISIAFPAAGPAIAIIQKIAPYAETAIPLIRSAISEGPAAFTAAKTAAPDFFSNLSKLATELKAGVGGNTSEPVTDNELAQLAAHVAGIDPPGWTHDETQRWWGHGSDH